MNILDNLAERIKQCSDEVDNRNRSAFILFSKGACFLAAIIICVSVALPYYHWLIGPHAFLFVYTIMLFFLANYCQQKKVKHIRAIEYLLFAPLLLGGAMASS